MKSHNFKKYVSIILASAMLLGTLCGCSKTENKAEAVSSSDSGAVTTDSLSKTGDILTKDETVYAMCASDGSISKIIVSDWIKNGTAQASIKDTTNLNDINVVKGNTTYTVNSGKAVWDAKSGDVYYQGTGTDSLPVLLTVSYSLDGKNISAEELAGKSGKVKIKFSFQNNEYKEETINGKKVKIYVPFVMMSGLVLDNSIFTNVEITNGKTMQSGENTIVIGYAMPGMNESLGLESNDDIDFPEDFEITADVNNFSLANTVTLASNSMFNDIDVDTDKIDDMKSQLNTLEDNMIKLADGSSELYDNLNLLLTKSNEIVSAIKQMSTAVSALSSGSSEIYSGSVSLRDNLKHMQDGLTELSSNNDDLNGGMNEAFETLIEQANSSLSEAGLDKLGITVPTLTVSNYDTVLKGLIAALGEENVYNTAYDEALALVKAGVEKQNAQIEAGVTANVKQAVKKEVTAGYKKVITETVKGTVSSQIKANADEVYAQYVKEQIEKGGGTADSDQIAAGVAALTDEQKEAIISGAVDANMATEEIQNQISSALAAKSTEIDNDTDANMQTSEVKQTITENIAATKDDLIAKQMVTDEITGKIAAAVAAGNKGAGELATLLGNLSKFDYLCSSVKKYTDTVSTISDGCAEIEQGSEDLSGYIKTLSDNLALLDNTLSSKLTEISELPDGVQKLTDGAEQIKNGINDINDLAIKKLCDFVNNDASNLYSRLQEIVKLSKEYNNYSGIEENMDGSVKFVYKTDSIGQ